MTETLTIPYGDDLHIHLREFEDSDVPDWENASKLAPCSLFGGFNRVLVMPNLKNPITTVKRALEYQQSLTIAEPRIDYLMTLYLTKDLFIDELGAAEEANIRFVKLYPAGATTNSAFGVTNMKAFYDHFKVMEELGLILSIHAEMPHSWDTSLNIYSINAEQNFIPIISDIMDTFPDLQIVVEHISSKEMVNFVYSSGTLGATITAHHLATTLDDALKDNSLVCKPIQKSPEDRQALIDVIKDGNPRFFFGSDSSPHPKFKKLSYTCPCGVFSSPYLMPILAQIFESHGMLDRLVDFTSTFGAQFYDLPPKKKHTMTLIKKPMVILEDLLGATPFMHGQTLQWSR